MERLALCSKVLYDRDILRMKKENDNLKNELKRYKKTFDELDDYYSEDEINSVKYKMRQSICKWLNFSIHRAYFEPESLWENEITAEIVNAYIIVTDNAEWSFVKCSEIIRNLVAFLNAYPFPNGIESFHNERFRETLANIMINIVNYHIDNNINNNNDKCE